MDNLNKLLRYLMPSEEINKIALEADVSKEIVEKACADVFTRLIPSDFNRQESSHIDKKDLNGISSNFNKLLSDDNLKKLINEISEKYGIEKANAGVLVKKVLVNIRGKLQYMMAVKHKEVHVQKRSEHHDEKPVKKEEINEEIQEKIKDENDNEVDEDDEMTKGEKIALYAVMTCLLIVIVLVIFILVKTLRG